LSRAGSPSPPSSDCPRAPLSVNVGITVGPWLGGIAIGTGLGYASVGWISAAMGIAMLVTVAWADRLRRKPTRPAAARQPVAELAH
jgi:DHA1 family chloramphenicol resistance protein-like MFS transporter